MFVVNSGCLRIRLPSPNTVARNGYSAKGILIIYLAVTFCPLQQAMHYLLLS
ncbi:MAG: hypothetical protein ACJAU3_001046 [Zhongshania sp.]|jgi:hypothetical protein